MRSYRYAYATLVSETIKDIMKSSKVTPVSIAAKILDKSLYYLETGDTGKMDLKVNLVEYQELGKINITTKLIQDAIEKYELIGEEEPDIE